jgi:hypothetical protein
MSARNRTSLAFGLILLLAGGWLLAQRLYPDLPISPQINFTWPWLVIGAGGLLLLIGLLVGEPGAAIPAVLFAGVGAILLWQSQTGDYRSWIYLWTLIPGLVGLGILLAGLLRRRGRRALQTALILVFISLALFLVFGSLFSATNYLMLYWPVLLIYIGAWMLLSVLFRRRDDAASPGF